MGSSSTSTAQAGQYTSSVPRMRIHRPPHLSQYFNSKWTISKPSISMIASWQRFVVRRQLTPAAQIKKPCADFSVTGPVSLTESLLQLFSYEYIGATNRSPPMRPVR
jgi:hypothetical protein